MRPDPLSTQTCSDTDLEYAVSGGEIPNENPSSLGEHRMLGGCLEQARTARPDPTLGDPAESPTSMSNDAWPDLRPTPDLVEQQAGPGDHPPRQRFRPP